LKRLDRYINGGKEVLWLSERDGWAHLYLYDVQTEQDAAAISDSTGGGSSGGCRQLTCGEWVVRGVAHVDDANRVLYFYAAGRESTATLPAGAPGSDNGHLAIDDPYLRRIYSLPLDEVGATPLLLTPEPADHSVVFSPAGDLLVDRYSRADLPTVAVLRRAVTGQVLLRLEEANISPLLELGWQMPIPCVTTCDADGKTPL
jgi:hypothetical protein